MAKSRFVQNNNAEDLANEHIENKPERYTTIQISESLKGRFEKFRKLKALAGEEVKQKVMLATAIEEYIERELKKLPEDIAAMFK